MRFNGNIIFDAGQLKNAYLEALATAPTFSAEEKGRLYFNTAESKIYFNDGEAWVALVPERDEEFGNLAGLQAMDSSAGVVVQTGEETFTKRTLEVESGHLTITNETGAAGNPKLALATITPTSAGTLQKITVDSVGRVTERVAATDEDLISILQDRYLKTTGGNMTGTLNMGTNQITGLAPGSAGTDAVNVNQLQSFVAGLSWKQSVRVATLENIPGFQAGTIPGPVATITIPNDNETYFPTSPNPVVIDGVSLLNGQRVLVKNQDNANENGIYVVVELGGGGLLDAVLERADDLNAPEEFTSASVLVTEGSQGGTGWTQTNTIEFLDTDDIEWIQFSGAGLYVGGDGIAINGNAFSVRMGAGITTLPTEESGGQVGIDLYDSNNSALILTVDGSTREPNNGSSQLKLLLNEDGHLEQSSTGLSLKPTYFLYESDEADDEHVVQHNLGQKYCNVTVVDSSDAVIIPQSIVFDDENTLTVTFSDDVDCKVVVMGIPSPGG